MQKLAMTQQKSFDHQSGLFAIATHHTHLPPARAE